MYANNEFCTNFIFNFKICTTVTLKIEKGAMFYVNKTH